MSSTEEKANPTNQTFLKKTKDWYLNLSIYAQIGYPLGIVVLIIVIIAFIYDLPLPFLPHPRW